MDKNTNIGFIGQGFVCKNLADNLTDRGYTNIVRYALEEPYAINKDKIKECELVFIAVPTPTTKEKGYDDSILLDVVSIIGDGAVVVVKSTVLPYTMRKLSADHPQVTFFHSPEFLTIATARYDTDNPDRNIIGVSDKTDEKLAAKAKEVLEILPKAKYDLVCGYEESTLIKYGSNCFFYFKNIFFNIFYELISNYEGTDFGTVIEAVAADPRIGPVHTKVVHKGGRGAGGYCLIKDYAAFKQEYEKLLSGSSESIEVLKAIEKKNLKLLRDSNKDEETIKGIYGDISN